MLNMLLYKGNVLSYKKLIYLNKLSKNRLFQNLMQK